MNERVMDSLGSCNYPDPLIPTSRELNQAKGTLMRLKRLAGPDRITDFATTAVFMDTQTSANELLSPIRAGFAVFEYLNRPHVVAQANMVYLQVRRQLEYIKEDLPGAAGIVAWWDLFIQDYFNVVGTRAQAWAREIIDVAAEPFFEARRAGRQLAIHDEVMEALQYFLNAIDTMTIPGLQIMSNLQP
ncbi:hypothetical protein QBC38DRAFT_461775 [Podospora fimiseda]|uniref:Uncharacterized protein n=1 Tax=Podospora fimiseda TaxID=252190 RepID=A0AAN6YMC2_9PEZI|nr:hypothetical protein QBC38DRAFT_461775 [Podospora fimiseda]